MTLLVCDVAGKVGLMPQTYHVLKLRVKDDRSKEQGMDCVICTMVFFSCLFRPLIRHYLRN